MNCFHCGLPCIQTTIQRDNQVFCCEGCYTVFSILKNNSLQKYYDLSSTPGKQPVKSNKQEYLYLDKTEFSSKFIEFHEKNTAILCFFIDNIHCASCIWLLENLYRLQEGITRSEVNFTQKTVRIVYDTEKLNISDIVYLLAKLGYPPSLSTNKNKDTDKNYSDLIRLGVASFCFGNVMLFSFPEYLSSGDVPKQFQKLFNYLNLVLTLPAYFYCGKEWLQSCFISIKYKKIDINVPIAIGLTTLLISSFFEILTQKGVGYSDSLCGFIFFLLLGKFFQKKTFANLSFDRDYKSYFPLSTIKICGTQRETVAVSQLEVGDKIFVRNQELIPVDAKVISDSIIIDYSFVTGESTPIKKSMGEEVFSGGRMLKQGAQLEVIKKHEEGFLMSMWKNVSPEKQQKNSLINNITPWFTFIILCIALVSFVYWIYREEYTLSWYVFSSVLIVACPCALALSTPFTHGAMLRILGQHKIFIKSGTILEKMAQVKHFVFDKTGTLTTISPKISFLYNNITEEEKKVLASLASQSIHPVSCAIVKNFPLDTNVTISNFKEVPGKGIEAEWLNHKISFGSASWICEKIDKIDTSLPENAVVFSIDNNIRCALFVESNFRSGWQTMVSRIAKNHIIHLISGDTNRDFNTIKDLFPKENIHFQLNPLQKTNYIKNIQESQATTAMIGDGLNDSGALRQSDIGIAVMEENSHFSPASDIIISAENINALPWTFELSKIANKIIYGSFVISFLYNLLGIFLAVQGALSPVFVAILMPLSSITVIVFTTLTAKIATKSTEKKYKL